MHRKFAQTSNVVAFYSAYAQLMQRGAEETSWLLVTGRPGHGKTKTIHNFAIESRGVYVRAKSTWTPTAIYQELCETLGLDSEGSARTLFTRLIPAIVERDAPIVVDEIRHLLRDGRMLEAFRDLSDVTGCVIIASGEDFVEARLRTRHPQIYRRIFKTVAFKASTVADVRLLCDELCELEVADDLVARIHKDSLGFAFDIKNAIAAVERHGRREHLAKVSAADMAGIVLCQGTDREAA